MDCVEPAEAQAMGLVQAGIVHPLRTGPRPTAVRQAPEDELRQARGEDAETLLVLAHLILGAMLLGAVAGNFDEPLVGVLQRHQQTRRPESGAVLSKMPPLVFRAAGGARVEPLTFRRAGGSILQREDDVRGG